MPSFHELVQNSWAQPVTAANKAMILHIKLVRLAKLLRRWHKQRMQQMRQEVDEAQHKALQLDQTQDL
jgi:hypothetical protein